MPFALPLPQQADLTSRRFWLVVLVGSLMASHFTLIDRTNFPNLIGLCILVDMAVLTLIFRQYPTFTDHSTWLPTLLGSGLVVLTLMRLSFVASNPGLSILPLVAGIGVSWIAAGFAGPRIFWRELVILSLLAIPRELGLGIWNIAQPLSLIVTKLVGYSLWYLGFTVKVETNQILFPGGGVIINETCAGVGNLIYVVQVAVIASLLFPLSRWSWRIGIFFLAIALSFTLNLLRVGILAALHPVMPEAFVYWHEGDGALVFTVMVIVGFCSLYLWLMQRDYQPHAAA